MEEACIQGLKFTGLSKVKASVASLMCWRVCDKFVFIFAMYDGSGCYSGKIPSMGRI